MMLPFKLGTVPETGGTDGKPESPRRTPSDDLL
jgi:hypothetical protein